jgi:N-acetyl-alpha-D-muramate 1-phosphate uridylyltransferase
MIGVPRIAMVLAAGLGTRMQPLTHDRPKALIPVGGRALVDHMLDRLAEAGVQQAVVNVHAFADLLIDHLHRRRGGPSVVISDERDHPAPLETGGGIKRAQPYLGEGPILIANIDSVWIEDREPPATAIRALCAAFDPARERARLLLAHMERTSGFDGPGDFFMDAEARLSPRRVTGAPRAPLNYMGVHIADPRPIYAYSETAFGLFPLWASWAAEGALAGQAMDGDWMHVGDPEALRVAEARLAR